MEKLVADLAVLYQKQRNYHWNMSGTGFIALHEFLEKEYDAFAEFVDEMAEIIRMKGSLPPSTLREYLDLTQFVEGDAKLSKEEMIQDLIKDYSTLLKTIKSKETDDANVEDFYVNLTKHLEKSLWLMKSEVNKNEI